MLKSVVLHYSVSIADLMIFTAKHQCYNDDMDLYVKSFHCILLFSWVLFY